MVPGQSIIIVLTICLALSLFVYFYWKNKNLKESHLLLLVNLNEDVLRNTSQIRKRNEGLDTYHFLKYNLSEALIVQSDINFS